MLTKRGTGRLAVVSAPACAAPAASNRTSGAMVRARPSPALNFQRRNGIAAGPTFYLKSSIGGAAQKSSGALLERGHLIQRFLADRPSVPVSARAVNDA